MGAWEKTENGYKVGLPFASLEVERMNGGWDWNLWCRYENVYVSCRRTIKLLPNAISECEAEYLRRFADRIAGMR